MVEPSSEIFRVECSEARREGCGSLRLLLIGSLDPFAPAILTEDVSEHNARSVCSGARQDAPYGDNVLAPVVSRTFQSSASQLKILVSE